MVWNFEVLEMAHCRISLTESASHELVGLAKEKHRDILNRNERPHLL